MGQIGVGVHATYFCQETIWQVSAAKLSDTKSAECMGQIH